MRVYPKWAYRATELARGQGPGRSGGRGSQVADPLPRVQWQRLGQSPHSGGIGQNGPACGWDTDVLSGQHAFSTQSASVLG